MSDRIKLLNGKMQDSWVVVMKILGNIVIQEPLFSEGDLIPAMDFAKKWDIEWSKVTPFKTFDNALNEIHNAIQSLGIKMKLTVLENAIPGKWRPELERISWENKKDKMMHLLM